MKQCLGQRNNKKDRAQFARAWFNSFLITETEEDQQRKNFQA